MKPHELRDNIVSDLSLSAATSTCRNYAFNSNNCSVCIMKGFIRCGCQLWLYTFSVGPRFLEKCARTVGGPTWIWGRKPSKLDTPVAERLVLTVEQF